MLKEIITIKGGSPSYLGQIEIDGKPFELPNGILNKMVTGCGATTLAIEDNYKTIVCSPRVKLLDNKSVQHTNTLLVKGGGQQDNNRQVYRRDSHPQNPCYL